VIFLKYPTIRLSIQARPENIIFNEIIKSPIKNTICDI